jgi:hypothetical protein
VRAIALLGAGSAAIHQLRYAIGYGNGAGHALAAHPHGYLRAVLPGLAAALIIAFAVVLIRLARRGSARPAQGQPRQEAHAASLTVLWLACALALAAIFFVQETLEGANAVTGGGWIGLALALPAGLLVALALRGADAAEIRIVTGMLRIQVAAASAVAVAPQLRPARLREMRLGARAPPPAFVV